MPRRGSASCPADAAEAISRAAAAIAADPAALDLDRLKRETETVGYPILPLVRQLAERAGDGGRWLHWGATTQDIMDTAAVLQIRDGLALIEADLDAVRGHLGDARAALSRHADGRAHPSAARAADHLRLQGGGVARRVRPARDAARRAEAARAGRAVRRRRRHLGLARRGRGGASPPAPSWPANSASASRRSPGTSRATPIVETVQFLALLGGSLGKIAFDIMLMSATEFGEAAEPFVAGRGSSSTMPQKRNPISCELILAAAKALRQHAGLILDAMVSDFERATGPWHVEWIALPESFGYAAGALHQASFMLGGLIVDPARMAKNLGMTHGLIVAEAVMMGLAPHTGRNEAHDLVYDACRAAIESDRPLYDVLLETPDVAGPLGAEKLRALTDPANYLGAAQAMVDRVLAGR